jgi:hypothetical protein
MGADLILNSQNLNEGIITENLLQSTGTSLILTNSVVGSNSTTIYGSIFERNLGGAISYNRIMVTARTINTSVQPSRNTNYNAVAGVIPINTSSKFYLESSFKYGNARFDFVANPVIACFGILPSAAFTANSLAGHSGLYFRAPYTTETNTLKFIVLQAGVEVIFDTGMPYTGLDLGLFKVAIAFDGSTLTYKTADDTTIYSNTIPNFLGTYTMSATTYTYGFHLATLGVQAGTILVSMWYDSIRFYVKDYLPNLITI